MSIGVSIVTATYNAASTLRHCLASVGAQTASVEHVVVDGGSSDGTLTIIEEHRHSLARIVSEPDRGIYDAMNKGLRLATGEVVGILNADDFIGLEKRDCNSDFSAFIGEKADSNPDTRGVASRVFSHPELI